MILRKNNKGSIFGKCLSVWAGTDDEAARSVKDLRILTVSSGEPLNRQILSTKTEKKRKISLLK